MKRKERGDYWKCEATPEMTEVWLPSGTSSPRPPRLWACLCSCLSLCQPDLLILSFFTKQETHFHISECHGQGRTGDSGLPLWSPGRTRAKWSGPEGQAPSETKCMELLLPELSAATREGPEDNILPLMKPGGDWNVHRGFKLMASLCKPE